MDEDFSGKNNEVDEQNENKSHDTIKNAEEWNLHTVKREEHEHHDGTVAVPENARLYVVLGWISAALTFFVSPLFAIAGITFGILLNRQRKGSGDTLIIANVVLGLINMFLGIVYVYFAKALIGY